MRNIVFLLSHENFDQSDRKKSWLKNIKAMEDFEDNAEKLGEELGSSTVGDKFFRASKLLISEEEK